MEIDLTFPKYIKFREDGSTFVRKSYDSWSGFATYWRPCGEWGLQVMCKNYAYYSKMTNENTWSPTELIPVSPQEFLHDNPYCTSPTTAKHFVEAWNSIPEDMRDYQDVWDEPRNLEHTNDPNRYYMHKEYYKEVNYTFAGFE